MRCRVRAATQDGGWRMEEKTFSHGARRALTPATDTVCCSHCTSRPPASCCCASILLYFLHDNSAFVRSSPACVVVPLGGHRIALHAIHSAKPSVNERCFFRGLLYVNTAATVKGCVATAQHVVVSTAAVSCSRQLFWRGPMASSSALVSGFMKNESCGINRTCTPCRDKASATTGPIAAT